MQNNTFINQINIMINKEQKDSLYKFPNVNARYMIEFERAYNNNYHHPVLVFVRQDIKDFNNNRTYYLYEKDHKIYEIQVIVNNEIVSTYTKPHNNKLQIPTVN